MPGHSATTADPELAGVLRARGQRVTTQRLVLHRVVRELDGHVTAEELQRAAADRLPALSLPTVYATLELFEALGLVRRVAAAGVTRFDSRTDDHAHLACRRCGRVEDLDVPLDRRSPEAAARRAGFAAERAETTVVGLCRACAG
jgi:Fur family ferric uptake transcriptional regulator/Fur family peroxide stress response transcriptional regulator